MKIPLNFNKNLALVTLRVHNLLFISKEYLSKCVIGGKIKYKTNKCARKHVFILMKSKFVSTFIATCLLFNLIIKSSYADQEVRLLEMTDSRRTIILNQGRFDGIVQGEMASLSTIREGGRYGESILVGKGYAVKIFPSFSIWYLNEINEPKALLKGRKFNFHLFNKIWQGKRKIKVGRRTIVAPIVEKYASRDVKKVIDDARRGYPKIVVKKDDDYIKGKIIHDVEKDKKVLFDVNEKDVEIIDISEWVSLYSDKSGGDLEKLYISELQVGPSDKEVRDVVKSEYVDGAVSNQIDKVNVEGFDIEYFYRKQKKDDRLSEIRDKVTSPTIYDAYLDSLDEKREANQEALKFMKEEGPRWSEDMSDQQLQDFIVDNAVEHELRRQTHVAGNKMGHEIYFYFGIPIKDNKSKVDSQNQNTSENFMGIGGEYSLGARFKYFDRYTLFANLFRNSAIVNLDNRNGTVTEAGFEGGINWYPFNYPTGIQLNLLYFGIFIGKSTSAITTNGVTSTYDVVSLPGLQAGIKYRFDSSIVVHGSLSYQAKDLTKIADGSDLPFALQFSEIKLGFTIGYIF